MSKTDGLGKVGYVATTIAVGATLLLSACGKRHELPVQVSTPPPRALDLPLPEETPDSIPQVPVPEYSPSGIAIETPSIINFESGCTPEKLIELEKIAQRIEFIRDLLSSYGVDTGQFSYNCKNRSEFFPIVIDPLDPTNIDEVLNIDLSTSATVEDLEVEMYRIISTIINSTLASEARQTITDQSIKQFYNNADITAYGFGLLIEKDGESAVDPRLNEFFNYALAGHLYYSYAMQFGVDTSLGPIPTDPVKSGVIAAYAHWGIRSRQEAIALINAYIKSDPVAAFQILGLTGESGPNLNIEQIQGFLAILTQNKTLIESGPDQIKPEEEETIFGNTYRESIDALYELYKIQYPGF